MKIWIVEIGEPLPLEEGARLHRYGEFSRYLASVGHEVTWWTSTFSHAPKKFVQLDDGDQIVDGVTLRLIHGPGYKKNISFARFKHQADFASKFYKRAQRYPLPDLIIAPVPTLSGAQRAVRLAVENNIPIFTDIRDFWPDAIADIAPKFARPLAKLLLSKLYWQIKYICKKVDGILYMSEEAYRYGLKHGKRTKSENDHFFPLGYTLRSIEEAKQQEAFSWLDKLKIDRSKFTCCFFGTMGRFFDLKLIIEAAAILEKKHNIQFVLAGDGSQKEEFMHQASTVKSVVFPGWVDAAKIQAIMSISQVGLAPYKAGENFSLPNKPFEYLAGGLPIISSISQELPQILAENNCGLTYSGRSVNEFIELIESLINNQDLCQEMGHNAKKLFHNQFSTKIIFHKIEQHLKEKIGEKK